MLGTIMNFGWNYSASALQRSPTALFCLAVLLLGDCDIDQRSDCDSALEIVCQCASRPCEWPQPPPVVAKLQGCRRDDLRGAGCSGDGYDFGSLDLCVIKAGAIYCHLLDSMHDGLTDVCAMDCDKNSCDLKSDCLRYQMQTCEPPHADAGAETDAASETDSP